MSHSFKFVTLPKRVDYYFVYTLLICKNILLFFDNLYTVQSLYNVIFGVHKNGLHFKWTMFRVPTSSGNHGKPVKILKKSFMHGKIIEFEKT